MEDSIFIPQCTNLMNEETGEVRAGKELKVT